MSTPLDFREDPVRKLIESGQIRRGCAREGDDLAGDWGFAMFRGILAELSGADRSAALSLAASIIAEAQGQRQLTAWVTGRASSFFPPDFIRCGIDLGSLVVVRVADRGAIVSVAEQLLQCPFGLVVIDLGRCQPLPHTIQNRLGTAARHHHAAILCLTRKGSGLPSLGPLISLHAATSRHGRGARFDCRARITKDKGRLPGRSHAEVRHGPIGLR